MKFIVNSKELSKRITVLNKVASDRNMLPILDHILFDLKKDLTLTASDLELTVSASLSVEISEGEGSVCIGTKLLSDLLKECKDEPLTFECDSYVKVTTSKGSYNLIWCEAKDFPTVSKVKGKKIVVPAKVFLDGLTKTSFAMGDDELRPIMNGVYIETCEGKIGFTATNAHKLCWVISSDFLGDEVSMTLPKKAVLSLKSMIKDGSVTIHVDDKNAFILAGEYKITVRLVEGRYPNFKSVIPQGNDKVLRVNKDDLLGSIKRVGVFSNKASGLIKLSVKDDLEVSAQDLDFAISAKENLNCTFNGEPIEIGFKREFLQEMVSNIDLPEAVITMSTSDKACLFDFENVKMLLMPMLIK